MKQLLYFLIALVSLSSMAQITKPVKWKSHVEPISATEFKLVMEATIEDQWHIYSQFTPEDGPLPAEFTFTGAGKDFQLVGKTQESATKRQFNEVFGVDEIYFEKKAVFVQKIMRTNPNLNQITAKIEYQVCKEVCINDDAQFTFTLPKSSGAETNETTAVQPETASLPTADTTSVTEETSTTIDSSAIVATSQAKTFAPTDNEDRSLVSVFIIAFLSGFAALLTPCVFPLIPMTVSYFTKTSKTRAQGKRNAILYGLSIILIYVLLGVVITSIFGTEAMNNLATNVWFNLVFFVILVVFAMSFLGAFELVLPNSWANAIDRQADKGGIVGILFMALALAVVSFSCTGPIVGTLLFDAAGQGGMRPIVGMLGFSSALALPFMLFALFPSWLNSLPKSGGWLNTVKVFLGFLELAFAFKFLSNADLVLQLHLLEREVFLAIWIAIFGALSLYLLGKIQLPHDSPSGSISVGRLLMALFTLTFTIYMIPGLWGAPLKLISAYPPPLEYSESPRGFGNSVVTSNTSLPEGAKFGPHDIVTFEDYEKGLAYAKLVNKPVMVDFTGHACVNCRKMENNVWSDPRVLEILKNDLVMISLYVDDRRKLPLEEQTISPTTGKEIETIGDKWTDLIISRYKTNSQPMYVIQNSQGQDLSPTIAYVSTEEYLDWLKKYVTKP